MATTDVEIEAHIPLAEFAWDLKVKYNQTLGFSSKEDFMLSYLAGEVTLSTVYENLFVATRLAHGAGAEKKSAAGFDFIERLPHGTRLLGDMKIGTLKKNGNLRRFVVSNVRNKLGKIYFVGWNWISNQPNFFAIPPGSSSNPLDYRNPACGFKIAVNAKSGRPSGSAYRYYCHDSWEKMALA